MLIFKYKYNFKNCIFKSQNLINNEFGSKKS